MIGTHNYAVLKSPKLLDGIELQVAPGAGVEELAPEALRFVAKLHRSFNSEREHLLERRKLKQRETDSGLLPSFLPETLSIRNTVWEIAPVPSDLQDRRVEIFGTTEVDSILSGLNSGARVFVADFEEMHSPIWGATVRGQLNLQAAISGRLELFSQTGGERATARHARATLMLRPRAWHSVEKNVTIDGAPVSASLFDFGVYMYHNARTLVARGSGPYFYLPKMESHREARLWNQVFLMAQEELDLTPGTIKATALIETVSAAFEMHEILFELREHSAGLSFGPQNYTFSLIKKFKHAKSFILPDRKNITAQTRFLKSCADLMIQTCHWRGAHAIGGLSRTPIKENILYEKQQEVQAGFDGTRVSHLSLIPAASKVFNSSMPDINQFHRLRADVSVSRDDLLEIPSGDITEEGLRSNVQAVLFFLEAWLAERRENSSMPGRESLASVEVSRAQIWQWMRRSKGRTTDGKKINSKYFEEILKQELIRGRDLAMTHLTEAADLFRKIVLDDEFADFLSDKFYRRVLHCRPQSPPELKSI